MELPKDLSHVSGLRINGEWVGVKNHGLKLDGGKLTFEASTHLGVATTVNASDVEAFQENEKTKASGKTAEEYYLEDARRRSAADAMGKPTALAAGEFNTGNAKAVPDTDPQGNEKRLREASPNSTAITTAPGMKEVGNTNPLNPTANTDETVEAKRTEDGPITVAEMTAQADADKHEKGKSKAGQYHR